MELSDEQKDLAIKLASEGYALKYIADELCITRHALYIYRKQNPSFEMLFNDARQEGCEHLAEALLTVHDEYVDVNKARLKSDNTKWYLSKIKPGRYGDRIDVNITQKVDISLALQQARQRAMIPIRDIKNVEPYQPNDIIDESPTNKRDLKSDSDEIPNKLSIKDLLG